MQSLPITVKVLNLNPSQNEVYLMQIYLIKFYQWLATSQWFSSGTLISSTNWLPWYNWNIVESDIKHHNPLTPLYRIFTIGYKPSYTKPYIRCVCDTRCTFVYSTFMNQASTLTYFSTCPFGQLTKKKYMSDSIF